MIEKMGSLEKQLQEVTMESEEKDRVGEEIVEQKKAAEKRAEAVMYYIISTVLSLTGVTVDICNFSYL